MEPCNNTSTTYHQYPVNPEWNYIILAIEGSLGFLFNAVLLFVLWRNKTPEFRVGTCYVIGNLALADCLTGVAVLLFTTRHEGIEIIQLPMVWTSVEASLMSLMFLSVERTLAVYYPIASRSIVTVRRTKIVIIFIWVLAITCGVLVHFYMVETQLAMTMIFEVCVVIFLLSQGYVLLKMQQRKRRNLFCDHDVSTKTKNHIRRQQSNNHVTHVVLILIVVVVVTLLPYMVALQIFFLSELHLRPPLGEERKVLVHFILYFYPIELLNFIVNPIIYAYRLKRYRVAFFNAFSFLQCGPFVKTRSGRGYSGTVSENEERQESVRKFRRSLRMTKVEH